MPKITNFAFCESASIKDNQPQAINFLQLIETSTGSFSFSIIFSIVGFSPNEDHTTYAVFSNPKGKLRVKTEEFPIEKEENLDKEASEVVTGITVAVEFSEIVFEGQGIYQLDLFFDDEKLGEFCIPVMIREGSEE